ncbi:MAG: hypothetical protein WB626_01165 [Bacteroidota bacterium]
MSFRTSGWVALAGLAIGAGSCSPFFHRSMEYGDVHAARLTDQSYFEDSSAVFFLAYANPFPDREILWFASYTEGDVALYVHNTSTDSVLRVLRFRAQAHPVFALAAKPNTADLVKCVIHVGGRPKCARLYPAFTAFHNPSWGTEYTEEVP